MYSTLIESCWPVVTYSKLHLGGLFQGKRCSQAAASGYVFTSLVSTLKKIHHLKVEQYQNHKENNRTVSYNQNGTQHKLLIL